MKINTITFFISIAISLLIAYAFNVFGGDYQLRLHISILTFILMLASLSGIISIRFSSERITYLTKTVSAIFLIIYFVTLIIIRIFKPELPLIIILSGLLFLLHSLIIYALNRKGS